MPLFDMNPTDLHSYFPARHEMADFESFWSATVADDRRHELAAQFRHFDAGFATIETFDVSFSGHDGREVKAWLILPAGTSEPLPCVVEFMGYELGRGVVHSHLLYSAAGYAHFVMDSRGQAGSDTSDVHSVASGPHAGGFLTLGITRPQDHYYRRLMGDAVRAVEAARVHPLVDADRVAVVGISQGGGLALAVAALAPNIAGLISDLPFLCHYRRAAELCDRSPYGQITELLRHQPQLENQLFSTLSYFDGVNFATRATTSALFSVALMDEVCPPSTVYAAYNHYAGAKEMQVWPFFAHQDSPRRYALHLRFLNEVFKSPWGRDPIPIA